MTDLDKLWITPRLTEHAEREAKRLAKLFNADTTDAKEIYRTLLAACVFGAMPGALKS